MTSQHEFADALVTFLQHPLTREFHLAGVDFIFDTTKPGIIFVCCPYEFRDQIRARLAPELPKSLRMEFAADA